MHQAHIFIIDSDSWVWNKSFYYLLKFEPSLWAMILFEKELLVLLDSRYYDKKDSIKKSFVSKRLYKNIKIKFILYKWDLVEAIINNLWKTKEIFLENNITYKYVERFNNFSWDYNIKIQDPYFEKNRIIKQKDEITSIKKAVSIIKKVWIYIVKLNNEWLLIWKSEIELRKIIIDKIFEYGWTKESFEAIVAFWKNSSIAHHESWNTIIKEWPLLVDMWAFYNWYCSDFTRTLWVNTHKIERGLEKNHILRWKNTKEYKEFKKIQSIVRKANLEAKKLAVKWNPIANIDLKAREVIESYWYWKYFSHSTWHWVWLDIHEKPFVNSKNTDCTIMSWMVFTIEPWIYLKWKFWVRYEDIIII